MHPVKHLQQPRFMRARVGFEGRSDGLLDLLRRENLVRAHRNVVVFAHQEVKDIDVILARLRPVHEEPGTGALAQGVVHILRVVREHAKGAIAPHDGVGPGKALHQNGSDFQLPSAGLPVAALARKLVNIVDGAKPNDRRIEDGIDKRLGVLARLALIAVDVVRAEVLVAERVARDGAIIIEQARHHLDQRGLARAWFAIAHEGKDEPTEVGEGVQAAVKVVGHEHFGEPERLVFGNVIAHNLMRFLEGHREGRGFRLVCGREALNGEIISLDAPAGRGERRKARGVLGAQGHLFHQRLGIGGDCSHKVRIVRRVDGNVLVQFPQRAVQGGLAVVCQDFLDLAYLDRDFGLVGGQKIGRGIAKDIERNERLGGQKLGELGLAGGGQGPFEIGPLEIAKARDSGVILGDGQSDGDGAPEGIQGRRLHGRHERVVIIRPFNGGDQLHGPCGHSPARHKARRGGPEPAAGADPA
mmetsp:Transcript_28445/g.53223  ORF Transcript_28445/g.53223 Transcript_28445/m.53223 type:complete len:471 (+) Transcript_28445:1199-2611(+)